MWIVCPHTGGGWQDGGTEMGHSRLCIQADIEGAERRRKCHKNATLHGEITGESVPASLNQPPAQITTAVLGLR